MSKKEFTEESGGGVDFLIRTMMERESSGKRQIRPTKINPDFFADESSGDSDYAVEDEEVLSDSGEDFEDDEEEDRDHNEGDGSESSSEDDESESESLQQKSALRATLEKLKDTENEESNSRRKKKVKKKKKPPAKKDEKSTGGDAEKTNGEDDQNSKSNDAKKKARTKKRAPANRNHNKGKVQSKRKITNTNTGSNSKKSKDKRKSFQKSISSIVSKAQDNLHTNRNEIDLKAMICSACLGERSDSINEIIECDNCGITVHEACYGVSETQSIASGSGSSCSTEPWFCDACKNGSKRIFCELCPNKGGLFKETREGRWVHLICALYTPGVFILGDTIPLLSQLSYSQWGAHPCIYCDDEKDGKVGICIRCDAGFCKTYLHVSCGQKLGLLSDPHVEQEAAENAESDLFYASCKLHTNREFKKRKTESWQVLQEQVRIKYNRKNSLNLDETERESNERIKVKLARVRGRVAAKLEYQQRGLTPYLNELANSIEQGIFPQENMEKCDSPSILTQVQAVQGKSDSDAHAPDLKEQIDEKLKQIIPLDLPSTSGVQDSGNAIVPKKRPRFLETSAGTSSVFSNKAANSGHNMKSLELEEKHERIVTNVSRKWNVHPQLNVEYAAYYADREIRITNLGADCERLDQDNNHLNDMAIGLQTVLDTKSEEQEQENKEHTSLLTDYNSLRNILKLLAPQNSNLGPSPDGKKQKQEKGGSGKVGSQRRKSSPASAAAIGPSSKKKRKTSSPGRSPARGKGRLSLVSCNICKKSDQQHLITRCDQCTLHFHIGCLDPPLTKLPRKTKLCGWMCSDCCDMSEEEPEQKKVDIHAPRTLRGRGNLKKPGKYRHLEMDYEIVATAPKKTSKSQSQQKSPSLSLTNIKLEPKEESLTSIGGPSPTLTNGDFLGLGGIGSTLSKDRERRSRTRSGSVAKASSSTTTTFHDCEDLNLMEVNQENVDVDFGSSATTPVKSGGGGGKRKINEGETGDAVAKKELEKESPNGPYKITVGANGPLSTGNPMKEKKKKKASRSSTTRTRKKVTGSKSKKKKSNIVTTPPAAEEDVDHVGSGGGGGGVVEENGIVSPTSGKNFPWLPPRNNEPFIGSTSTECRARCKICHRFESRKSVVTCDKCRKDFHFGCLNPPLNYSPKRRGYSWFCNDCDDTSSIDSPFTNENGEEMEVEEESELRNPIET